MGLQAEYTEALDWVKKFDFSKIGRVSFFETTIRDLGGMLSAYDMTSDPELLIKSADLGDRLLKAFDASPLKIPTPQVSAVMLSLSLSRSLSLSHSLSQLDSQPHF